MRDQMMIGQPARKIARIWTRVCILLLRIAQDTLTASVERGGFLLLPPLLPDLSPERQNSDVFTPQKKV